MIKVDDQYKLIGIHIGTQYQQGVKWGVAVSATAFNKWLHDNPAPSPPETIQICKTEIPLNQDSELAGIH